MCEDRPDKQAKTSRQNAVASKEQQQLPDRRWLQDALEDDEVREALKSLHARGNAKSDSGEADRS